MMRFGWRRIGNLGIRVKLLLLIMLLLSFVTGAISLANLEMNNRETRTQAQYSSEQALRQTAGFVENKCSTVIDTLDILASNDTILELIQEPVAGYTGSLTRWWADATRMNTVLFSTRSNRDIRSFHLYFSNGFSRISGNADFTLLDEVAGEPWYAALMADPTGYRWFAPGELSRPASDDVVTAVRKIPSQTDLHVALGLIRADLPVALLRDILDQGRFAPSAVLALVNGEGRIMCTTSGFGGRDEAILSQIRAETAKSGWSPGQSRTFEADGEEWLVGIQTVRRSDWMLVSFIRSADVQALGRHVQRRILLVFLITAPLSLPLAYLAAQSSTNRIRQLALRMRKIGAKDEPSVGRRAGDEIDELERDFQEMIARIEGLLEEEYRLGVSNKNLELKALQAQINPHFLYNTLDLINMMGLRSNHPEIAALVKALAMFYRLSLGKGEDIVTVGRELELVRAYMTIQNMRFDNCVTLEIEVPQALLDVPMPKIILQPLVENAVLHGILESESERGTVRITGGREDGCVVIRVRDDVQGMEPALAEKLSSLPQETGYGVRNITERLRLQYGPASGLVVESAPGQGTTVTIRMPEARGGG